MSQSVTVEKLQLLQAECQQKHATLVAEWEALNKQVAAKYEQITAAHARFFQLSELIALDDGPIAAAPLPNFVTEQIPASESAGTLVLATTPKE